MSRSNWTLESVDGDFEPCSVSEFIDANRETFSAAEIRAIRKLRPGQKYSGGGGAWGEFTVRRQAELRRNYDIRSIHIPWPVIGLAVGALFYFGLRSNSLTWGTRNTPLASAQDEYALALRVFASAKGAHASALLRKTDHPGDAAAISAYDAAVAQLGFATIRINAARDELLRLGLPT